jgi:hypothetical protein
MDIAWLTIANLSLSWGLMVLIWLVQIIIYPGFIRIPGSEFRQYHAWYMRRIAVIVSPLMVAELTAVAAWLYFQPQARPAYFSAAAVFTVWGSTLALQVPIHRRLQHGKDAALIRRLVATNWIRTAAWSAKAFALTIAFL